jgi:hypothetical protein
VPRRLAGLNALRENTPERAEEQRAAEKDIDRLIVTLLSKRQALKLREYNKAETPHRHQSGKRCCHS